MIRRLSTLRWVVAGLALELCWLFICESFREREPVFLGLLVVLPGTLLAGAWHTMIQPATQRTAWVGLIWLAAALVAFDQLLDMLSPYPRRFGLLDWEALRIASLVVGFGAAAKLAAWRPLPGWWRAVAGILCAASLILALLVPAAITYVAIDGSRDRGEPADAALVLGFALAEDGTPRPQLVGRMEHAVDLVKRGRVTRLVLSGGAGKNGRTEAQVMRDLALAAGVAADVLVLDEAARSTIENFACSRPLLERAGAKRVLVVTEPWHMTRAMLLARRHGFDAQPSPSSSAIWRSPRAAGYWLFRDAVAYLRERARNPFAEPGTCGARECEGCRNF